MDLQGRAADSAVSDFERQVAKLPTVAEDPGHETPLCPHCNLRTYIPYVTVRACLKCGRAYRIVNERPCGGSGNPKSALDIAG